MKTRNQQPVMCLVLLALYHEVDCTCMDRLLKEVEDDAITASSFYGSGYEPWVGRLYTGLGWGNKGSWRAKTNDPNQYIQVTFPYIYNVSGVLTQENKNLSHYVMEYEVVYSPDGQSWSNAITTQNTTTFVGNDGSGGSPVRNKFLEQIQTKYVRIKPVSWSESVGMRFDILGCPSGLDTNKEINNRTVCSEYLVSGPRGVSDMAFSASSFQGTSLEPWRARINSTTGWQSLYNDLNQYIQVEFDVPAIVTCIITRSKNNVDEFTRSYNIQYSLDGATWETVNKSDGSETLLLPGNHKNRNTEAITCLPNQLYTRYVRLLPVTWRTTISVRFDALGCYNNTFEARKEDPSSCVYENRLCSEYLVSGPRGVPDMAFSASSFRKARFEPWRARITDFSSWEALQQDLNQYIQIEFEEPTIVTCITTSSRHSVDNYVRSYLVQYSSDGKTWQTVNNTHGVGNLLFPGNYDTKLTEAVRILPQPLITRYIRLVPVTWQRKISLRFDVLGCYNNTFVPRKEELSSCLHGNVPCSEYLVSGPQGVPDMAISVSSYNGSFFEPWMARLHSNTSWIALHNDLEQYIQVKFDIPSIATCITTNDGFESGVYGLRSYYVQYSSDGETWKTVTRSDDEKLLFPGNTNQKGLDVIRILPRPLFTRYIRLVPVTWKNHISLRFDVIGCHNSTFGDTTLEPTTSTNPTTESTSTLGRPTSLELTTTPAESTLSAYITTTPAESTLSAEIISMPASSAEFTTTPAEPIQSADITTTPAELAPSAELTITPAEPASSAERATTPAEPTQSAEITITPAEPASLVELATTPVEPTQSAEILSTPAETAPSAELATAPAEPAPSADITTTPAEPTPSTEITASSKTPTNMTMQSTTIDVSCSCSCITLPINLTIGSPELEAKIKELIFTTKVGKNETSSAKRSKTCANDDRPASKGLGLFGVVVLSGILFLLLTIDFINIVRMLQRPISFFKDQLIKHFNTCSKRF